MKTNEIDQAKQYAIDLINKFSLTNSNYVLENQFEESWNQSKLCALICVDEMLSWNVIDNNYLFEVREQLEKL
jgi:hypothetical protein